MTTTRSFHEEHGVHPIHPFGAAANKRGRVVVSTALMALALSAGGGPVRAHEKSEKSEQTVIKSREFTIPRGSARSYRPTSR